MVVRVAVHNGGKHHMHTVCVMPAPTFAGVRKTCTDSMVSME